MLTRMLLPGVYLITMSHCLFYVMYIKRLSDFRPLGTKNFQNRPFGFTKGKN